LDQEEPEVNQKRNIDPEAFRNDPQMKDQVTRLLKNQKLKDDLVAGNIDIEDLSDQDLLDLDL
jgi:hypothetical protein